MVVNGLNIKYIRYPINPPITLVIKSVISDDRKSFIKGCSNSMDKLNKKVYKTTFSTLTFAFFTKGNKNPKGIVITIFNNTCLIKSPLPLDTSINGMKTSVIARFVILGLLWLGLVFYILTHTTFTLYIAFVIVASAIIIFVPMYKKYVKK